MSVLRIVGTLLTFAVPVMAFFAHADGSPVRPYLYATVPVWLAVLLLTWRLEERKRVNVKERSN